MGCNSFNNNSVTLLYLVTFQVSWVNLSRILLLAYKSLGVVYGDLSTSPLYVYSSTFLGKLHNHNNEEVIFGAFSLIFWTITLIPLLKYVFILLSRDDNGEGGTFDLYSLLCRHAKFSLLPNQQAADEELSSYKYGSSSQVVASSPLKRFLEKHKRLRTSLLVVVLLGVHGHRSWHAHPSNFRYSTCLLLLVSFPLLLFVVLFSNLD